MNAFERNNNALYNFCEQLDLEYINGEYRALGFPGLVHSQTLLIDLESGNELEHYLSLQPGTELVIGAESWRKEVVLLLRSKCVMHLPFHKSRYVRQLLHSGRMLVPVITAMSLEESAYGTKLKTTIELVDTANGKLLA